MPEYPQMPENGGDKPDIFPRLSIAMCPQDDGTRPVNPVWVGSDVGFLSPAIKFASFPLPAGQPTKVDIQINNLGTADSTGVMLETAYNIYIGNQAATMVNIQNATIPLIPAGYPYTATVTWTPPSQVIAHACFHARVSDTYSKLHYPARCMSWNSYINPQAGSHNTILLKVPDTEKAAVVTYPAVNLSTESIQPKLLVTVIDNRTRFADLDERFPLPFVPDHLTSSSILSAESEGAEDLYALRLDHAMDMRVPGYPRPEAIAAGLLPRSATSLRWPRETVNSRFVHGHFGFDVEEELDLQDEGPRIARRAFFTEQPLESIELQSYGRLQLAPGEEKLVRLVIPPREFPQPGRRRKFQIDYQVGDERPMQNFVYLYS